MRGKIVAAETAHDDVRRYVNSAADRPRTIAPRTLERIHADTLPACQTSRLERMDRGAVVATCRGLPAATEGFPFGEGALVFKVGGKMFAIVGASSVSLKCDPVYAAAFREQYSSVTAGYHLDKRHWNTVELDGSVPAEVLTDWIQDSYDLVVDGLPRAQRQALRG